MHDLGPPMARALELAWEWFRAGSLGVGATVSRHGEVHLAAVAAPVAEVAAARWDRLGACVPDVERVAAVQPT